MRKYTVIALILLFSGTVQAKRVNWIIASVGKYPITKYDLQLQIQFGQDSGNPKYNEKTAMQELLTVYSLMTYAKQDEKFTIRDEDIQKALTAATNVSSITNADEKVIANYRRELYLKYPDAYVLQMKKQHIMRSLLFYNEDIKDKASRQVSETEMKKYYEENKEGFVSRPSVDFIVLAVNQPMRMDLDQLLQFEDNLKKIADRLKWSDDVDYILNRYGGTIHFLPYSGRTGLKAAFSLLKEGYPQEVLNLCFMDKIPLPGNTIVVKPGAVIYLPQPIPIGETRTPTYLIVKLMAREKPEPIPYAEARELIEAQLKEQVINSTILDFLAEKVKSREIVVNIIDKTYSGVYDEFIRR